MKTSDVIEFFGGAAQAAKKIGITHQAIYKWGETVPPVRQWHIQALTDGALQAEMPSSCEGSSLAP